MNLKMKQTKIGNIIRSLNMITVGVLLTLIGFISSSRVASAAYSDPNCRDQHTEPVPGTSCTTGGDIYPTGEDQCASGINGSTNVCCSYTEYVTTCRATGIKVDYNYILSASYGNSYCFNGHCMSYTAPSEG